MNDIFKICYLNKNVISNILVFSGILYDEKDNILDLNVLFKENRNKKIFKDIFTNDELININDNNI